jgi:hypothetical protein
VVNVGDDGDIADGAHAMGPFRADLKSARVYHDGALHHCFFVTDVLTAPVLGLAPRMSDFGACAAALK